MQKLALQPLGPVDATVTVPGSKSLTNRALLVAALAEGNSTLTGCLFSDDTRYMLDALKRLGVKCEADEKACTIQVAGCNGKFPNEGVELFVGNAGTAMRFLTAACAACGKNITIDGNERMRQRPIGELLTALKELGAEVSAKNDCPPVRIGAAGITGVECCFTDPQSSQYVSAVALALPYTKWTKTDWTAVQLRGRLVSEPYVQMTLAVMNAFGGSAGVVSKYGEHADSRYSLRVIPSAKYRGRTYAIEPDASSASYPLAIAAVTGGCVKVQGLGTDSKQGDAHFVDVLEKMGCTVRRGADWLEVRGDNKLRGIDVNLADMPDMAQTLAAVAMFAEGKTTIRGVANLRIKETDRIAALDNELTKLGAKVIELADGLSIEPPPHLHPAEIDTYDDHRMAMSFAVIGAKAPGIVIRDPGCVSKTFPDFFERFDAMRRRHSTE